MINRILQSSRCSHILSLTRQHQMKRTKHNNVSGSESLKWKDFQDWHDEQKISIKKCFIFGSGEIWYPLCYCLNVSIGFRRNIPLLATRPATSKGFTPSFSTHGQITDSRTNDCRSAIKNVFWLCCKAQHRPGEGSTPLCFMFPHYYVSFKYQKTWAAILHIIERSKSITFSKFNNEVQIL